MHEGCVRTRTCVEQSSIFLVFADTMANVGDQMIDNVGARQRPDPNTCIAQAILSERLDSEYDPFWSVFTLECILISVV